MKRSLHKHPTIVEYRASSEPESIKRQAKNDTPEPDKRTASGRKRRPPAAVILLGLIAVLIIAGVSSWQTNKRKAAEEELKIRKWAVVFDNYTAKTAGKESTIWLLELQELGELLEEEEEILFGDSEFSDDGTEELKFVERSDNARELDLVVKAGDSVWNISVKDISGVRTVTVRHDPVASGDVPDIVNSLTHDLFGLDPEKDIPAQMGITEEMLSDRVPDTEYDSFSTYRILDFVKYEQDLYMVSTYEYDDPSFGINMYRYGESDPVDLDLRWNTECGNLPYMMSISFREELLYSSKS